MVNINNNVPVTSDDWWLAPVQTLDNEAFLQARERQRRLTKPPGSLGRLEALAMRLAAMQGSRRPSLERVRVVVFVGDHGVAQEGVSAFPQSVTVEMMRNFARGGAAISVLARELGAELEVVDVGAAGDPGPLPGVISRRIAAGTANLRREPAMDEAELLAAMDAGREAVERAIEGDAQLFIGGEMGIANTTPATALACALLDQPARALVGPGTGLDAEGVARKAGVIDEALGLHALTPDNALRALRCVGGFEIVALTGAFVRCAQRGMPVLVDGFIAIAAALAAVRLQPRVSDWLLYAHRSAEPGMGAMLQALRAEPLLDLGLRLGEGSGAALALPLLRLAVALHAGMATFAEAGVSGQEE